MQSSLQYNANFYAQASAKSFAMKTIGQQAQQYRVFRGWNSTRMAKEVGTSRQNIESLEKVGARTPHYISDLARVMKTSVDVLMRGEYSVESSFLDDQDHVKRTLHPRNSMISVPAYSDNHTSPSDNGIDIYQALEKVAWAISKSPHRGSDALSGVFASLCKEPENQLYIEMLERLLKEKKDGAQKAASRAA